MGACGRQRVLFENMAWQGVVGHDDVVEWFRRSMARNRLAHTYLFTGPPGVGKRTFAERLARTLLCPASDRHTLLPCGQCDSCRQAAAGTHPDLLMVSKPPDRNVLPIELFVGGRDHRMQQGLCHDIGLKPFLGHRRVAIIDDAHDLNEESANCLLKTLEEPPPHSVIILCAVSQERVLATIRSRCQWIRFGGLPSEALAELLLKQGVAEDRESAERLAAYAEGSLGRAAELADPQVWQFRRELLAALAEQPLNSVALAESALKFVDQAGREAVARRQRGKLVVQFAIEFYRALVRWLCDAPTSADADLADAVARAARHSGISPEMPIACVDRCTDALDHVDRYVHQGAWLPALFDDLARILQPASTARS